MVAYIPIWSDWACYLSIPKAIEDGDGDNGNNEKPPDTEANGNFDENDKTG